MREPYPLGYTLKEKAFVETIRFLMENPAPSKFTLKEIARATRQYDHQLQLKDALERMWQREMVLKDTKEVAYRWSHDSRLLSPEDIQFCIEVSKGNLPPEWTSKQAGRRDGVPKTTLRILRALSSNMEKSYTVAELANAFGLADTTVRAPMDRFVQRGLVKYQDPHDAAFLTNKAPKYYYLTPEGRQAFHKAYAEASEYEKRCFQTYSARDLLAVGKIGQWVNPEDNTFQLPPDEVAYIETGVRPEVSDDDEIEI